MRKKRILVLTPKGGQLDSFARMLQQAFGGSVEITEIQTSGPANGLAHDCIVFDEAPELTDGYKRDANRVVRKTNFIFAIGGEEPFAPGVSARRYAAVLSEGFDLPAKRPHFVPCPS